MENSLDPIWRDIKSSVLLSLKLEGRPIPDDIDDLVDRNYQLFLNDMNSLPFESEDDDDFVGDFLK